MGALVYRPSPSGSSIRNGMHVNGGRTHQDAVTFGGPPGLDTSASTVTYSPCAGTQGVHVTFEIVGFTAREVMGTTATKATRRMRTASPLEPINRRLVRSHNRLSGSPVDRASVESNKYGSRVWNDRETGGRGAPGSDRRPVGGRYISRADCRHVRAPRRIVDGSRLHPDRHLREPASPFELPRDDCSPRLH